MYKLILSLLFVSSFGLAQKKIELYSNLTKSAIIPLSEISSRITYIPLETNENCILSEELQIHITPNNIFVGDQQTMKFYRFDREGKYLNTIGHKGQGPEEYSYALSFYVNEKDASVYIIDNQKPALYNYSYEGTFIESVPLETSTWTMNMLGNSIVYFNSRYNRFTGNEKVYELYLSDQKGKKVKKRPTTITSDKHNMILFDPPFFYSYSENLYYKNGVREEVYLIDNNLNMKPHYIIDCGGNKNNHSKEDFKNIEKYGEKIGVRNIFENDRNLLITYVYDNKMNYLWGDKSNWNFTNSLAGKDESGFKEDTYEGPPFRPHPHSSSKENILISIVSAYDLLNNSKDRKKVEQNFPKLSSLTEEDNMIIVIADLIQ